MFSKHPGIPAAVAGVLLTLACASTTIGPNPGAFQLTGTFAGIQDGTANGVTFQDEQFVLLLIQQGDSVTGTYDVTGIQGGDFLASIDRKADSVFIDFVMNQINPCPGTFMGRAEARAGVGLTGEITIGIAGAYDGTDCDGDVDAVFFVQN